MTEPAPVGRPDRLVVVVGTATEIGKTWVTAALARELTARGCNVAARKPAQSFEPGDDERGSTDAHALAAATGVEAVEVSPAHRWYAVPMAPPMAAAELGREPIRLAELITELSWPHPPPAFGFVETAGGVHSPLAEDGDAIELIARLQPDVVLLVADAGLGTVNAVRLSMGAIRSVAGGAPTPVFLNRFSPHTPLHQRNRAWLEARDGLAVLVDIVDLADAIE